MGTQTDYTVGLNYTNGTSNYDRREPTFEKACDTGQRVSLAPDIDYVNVNQDGITKAQFQNGARVR